MGQDISKAVTPPPLSFRDCLIDGRIDVAKYMIYSQSIFEEDTFDMVEFSNCNKRKRYDHDSVTSSNKKARQRSAKRFPILCRGDDGSIREVTSQDSI